MPAPLAETNERSSATKTRTCKDLQHVKELTFLLKELLTLLIIDSLY
jgi:hypothetical protein